ncbi:hypothetical protein DERF_003293 [Dermatophagoides farinae]|uniref:Uncharacterized protein n=1 Tax=Dermatophagoides farinae TaxID=6954 RepID=A0A922LAF3_DERFA|nr:hypothetical protein DERF_003293 [Dermatophagoides farinae]
MILNRNCKLDNNNDDENDMLVSVYVCKRPCHSNQTKGIENEENEMKWNDDDDDDDDHINNRYYPYRENQTPIILPTITNSIHSK